MSPPTQSHSTVGHSPDWQQAYVASAPEDGAQRDLVAQLALPMNADQTAEQARRVDALQAQITLMAPATAQRMYTRLTIGGDPLGNLFQLTLHPTTIKSLLGQLDAKRRDLDRGTAPERRGTDDRGTRDRSMLHLSPKRPQDQHQPSPKPVPPPQPPPVVLPPWQPPTAPQSRYPVLPPWIDDMRDPPDSTGHSWTWSVLRSAAGALGMTVSVGLRAVTSSAMEKALEAAWIVFQTVEAEPAALVGMAGEAAAEAFLAEILGVDPSAVRNLNELMPNFPGVDLISPRWIASVKTRGVLSVLPPAALTESLRSQYTSDLLGIITGDTKLESAAEALLRNRKTLGRAWPRDLRATTVDGVVKYLRDESVLLVPSDHVTPLRQSLGSDLYRRLKDSKKALDQLGIKDDDGLASYVNRQIRRIQSIGPSSSEFRVLAEAVHDLPDDVNQKFRLEHAQILLQRAKRSGR